MICRLDLAPGTVLSTLISYNLCSSGGTRSEGMANRSITTPFKCPHCVPPYQMFSTMSRCCGSGGRIYFCLNLKRATRFCQRLKKHPLLCPERILGFLSADRHKTRWLADVFMWVGLLTIALAVAVGVGCINTSSSSSDLLGFWPRNFP